MQDLFSYSVFFTYALTSFFMFGLIWFVQVIHYPLFLQIPEPTFQNYHQKHTRLAGILIAPVMLLELLSLIILAAVSFDRLWLIELHLVLILLIWASTFGIQVPLHRKLEKNKCEKSIRLLVHTNWIRSFLWSMKAILILISLFL